MKRLIYICAVCMTVYTTCAQQITVPAWNFVGPTSFPVNGSGQINGIGRVTKIKFDPVQANKLYATSASGGLWTSTDGGTSWTGTGTDRMLYHKEATVCIDYTNTNILYLGTGDPNYYYSGYGVYKSTDGGTTWHQSNSGMGNRLVDELLMDPATDSTLIAATDDGIYKSYNAGASWVQKLNGGKFTDMDFKPGANGRVIYACTFDSVYRSDNAGETWSTVTAGYYIPGGTGMGIRIAVTPADTNVVYLGMVADRGSIFKSTDGGHSFTVIKDSFALSLTGYSTTDGGQGNYNFDINVDPGDPNTIYLVSQSVWKSTQGGIPSSWQQLTDWWAVVHTDMHHITFDPYHPGLLYNANDGAVWLTADSGATWTEKSDGLDATEIAPAASSHLDPSIISIGTQDNGELYYDGGWITNRGGDWYEYMAYDYFNPETVYYGNGNRRIVSAGDQSMNLPFINDYDRIEFSQSNYNVAFVGKDTIVSTTNLNASSPTWNIMAILGGPVQAMALSPVDSNKLFIITNDDTLHICSNARSATPVFVSHHTPASTYSTAGIVVINDQPNVVYMYNGGNIYMSGDTGITWTNVTYNYPVSLNIVGMVHDRYTTDQSIFVANTGGVYFRNMSMTTWEDYSGSLPSVAQIQGLDAYNNGSSASRLRAQYYGRGMWEAPINTINKSVAANFGQQYVCGTTEVLFSDSSYNGPTSWAWSFPGGTPATSTAQNPTVSYPAAGTYPVTLTAGNSNGTDTKTGFANVVVYATDSMPISQGFESAVFPPVNWVNIDGGGDSIVWQLSNYGGYGASAHSMYFDNYDYNESGLTKSMRFSTDLTHYDSLLLTFDVAYQTIQNYSDSLEVAISTDCGHTFERIYIKGGNTLATAPHIDSPEVPFYPTAAQWRTDSVYLYGYSHQPNVVVSFNNISGYGTDLYVDNIDLHGAISNNPTGILTATGTENLSIYPNPTKGMLTVSWSNAGSDNISLSIYDALGRNVRELRIPLNNTTGSSTIDLSSLSDGIYCIRAETDTVRMIKVSVQK